MRSPRRTVRMRLTLLYGTLFLLSGAGLLAITYGLVVHATSGPLPIDGPDIGPPGPIAPSEAPPLDSWLREQAAALRHQFLVQSGIALALMAVVSVALGWITAGRVLRPLREITTTTRHISASNLHERLSRPGPDDELKELGDTIDGLLQRLEGSFRSQRQFVANAAHELYTPLARERTLIQVALSDPDASVESLRSAHERVLAANHQQQRLIEAMLTLARSEGGVPAREPFDLAAIADRVILAMEPEAEQRGLRIVRTTNHAPASGDPRLVERLIANLVDNALRYNTESGQVDVTTEIADGQAVLSVTNTGPSIPEADIGRLFEPFQRLEARTARTSHGEGLGLSIVKAIATAHGATVTAQPCPGGGLRVTVTFPD